ncbi:UNVERIFIED_CONTAM: hypothetical protein FKN15_050579 [Acipenser sinensis]
MYEGYLQHDAQEVLQCILSYIQEACETLKKEHKSQVEKPGDGGEEDSQQGIRGECSAPPASSAEGEGLEKDDERQANGKRKSDTEAGNLKKKPKPLRTQKPVEEKKHFTRSKRKSSSDSGIETEKEGIDDGNDPDGKNENNIARGAKKKKHHKLGWLKSSNKQPSIFSKFRSVGKLSTHSGHKGQEKEAEELKNPVDSVKAENRENAENCALNKQVHKTMEEKEKSSSAAQCCFDLMERLFQGQLVLRTRCLECECYTERREDFQDISVPVQEDEPCRVEDSSEISPEPKMELKTLKWAISQFASVERIVGEDKYFCETCHHYTEAERSLLFDKTPEVVTIHLKCFAANSSEYATITLNSARSLSAFRSRTSLNKKADSCSSCSLNHFYTELKGGVLFKGFLPVSWFDPYAGPSKVNTPLQTPLKLSLEEWCTKPSKEHYELFAVVMHNGVTISSGHYTTYVKMMDLGSIEIQRTDLKEESGVDSLKPEPLDEEAARACDPQDYDDGEVSFSVSGKSHGTAQKVNVKKSSEGVGLLGGQRSISNFDLASSKAANPEKTVGALTDNGKCERSSANDHSDSLSRNGKECSVVNGNGINECKAPNSQAPDPVLCNLLDYEGKWMLFDDCDKTPPLTYRLLNPMYEGYLQHDAQEVLQCILSYIQEACETLKKEHKSQVEKPGDGGEEDSQQGIQEECSAPPASSAEGEGLEKDDERQANGKRKSDTEAGNLKKKPKPLRTQKPVEEKKHFTRSKRKSSSDSGIETEKEGIDDGNDPDGKNENNIARGAKKKKHHKLGWLKSSNKQPSIFSKFRSVGKLSTHSGHKGQEKEAEELKNPVDSVKAENRENAENCALNKQVHKTMEEKEKSSSADQCCFDLMEMLFQGQLVLRTRCLECECYTERREDFQDISVPVQEDEPCRVEDSSENQCCFDLMERLFQGQLVLRTRCLECECYTERREDFQDISVPVQEDEPCRVEDSSEISPEPKMDLKTLKWAISQFASVERIVGEDKYFCETCHHYTEAERSLLFDKTPEVVTIHLKCFAANSSEYATITLNSARSLSAFRSRTSLNKKADSCSSCSLNHFYTELKGGVLFKGFLPVSWFDPYAGPSKVNTPLQTPLKLSLEEWCTKPSKEHYELFAVVMHNGVTISSGHYTTYVKMMDLGSIEIQRTDLKEESGVDSLKPEPLDEETARACDPQDYDDGEVSFSVSGKSHGTAQKVNVKKSSEGVGLLGGQRSISNFDLASSKAANPEKTVGALTDNGKCERSSANDHSDSLSRNGKECSVVNGNGINECKAPNSQAPDPVLCNLLDYEGKWMLFDDCDVRLVEETEFLSSCSPASCSTSTPYLLFYKKVV